MPRIAQMIADRLILRPTKHSIEATEKIRRMLPFRRGSIETWTQRIGTHDPDEVDIFVLKFSGAAGRAERATYHPMDHWSELRAELWSVNPPGFGGSSGTASVQTLAEAADTVFANLVERAQRRPIVVMGNSLGTVSALYLAANYDVAGLVLRNPPPLRQLIMGRHGWWNLWLGSFIIAQRVPAKLCSIRNAKRCECPAVIVSSRRDETVPPLFQDKVIDAYAGPRRVMGLSEAGHAASLNLDEQREYMRHLDWLRGELTATHGKDLTVINRRSPARMPNAAHWNDGRSSKVERQNVSG